MPIFILISNNNTEVQRISKDVAKDIYYESRSKGVFNEAAQSILWNRAQEFVDDWESNLGKIYNLGDRSIAILYLNI